MALPVNNPSRGKKQVIVFSILGGIIIIGGLAVFLALNIVKNKFEGSLQVDGSEFIAQKCSSGSALGFSGIQLADAGGRRIRVISDPISGDAKVALFNPSQTAEELGPCAKLEMYAQNSTVNGTKNQRGTVTFSCTNGQHKIAGTVQFKNCH
jgi:hypothetical protein